MDFGRLRGLAESTAEGFAIRDDGPVRPSLPFVFHVAAALWVGLLVAAPCADGLRVPLSEELDGAYWADCTVSFSEDAKSGRFGAYGTVSVSQGSGRSVFCQAVFEWPSSDVPPLAGEVYRAHATFSAFDDAEAADQRRRGHLLRVRLGSLSLVHPGGMLDSISSFRRDAIGLFDGEDSQGSALVRALVLGDRSVLSEGNLYASMQILGLAHLVAVSGAHLSVVASVAGSMLRRARLHRYAASGIVCAGICAYVVLTGCSVSVMRAAVMACIATLSVFSRRRSSSLAALSVCVCIMLALRPENAWSLSFQLSVLATLGVVLFTPLFSHWMRPLSRRIARDVLDAMSMTCAANLTALPVTACVFGRLPLLGMFANIPATMFLAVFLPAGCLGVLASAACAPLFPGVADAVIGLLCAIADPFASACVAASSFPLVSAPAADMPWVYALLGIGASVGIWVLWPANPLWSPKAAVVAVAVGAVLVVAPAFVPDRIVALDVGQGDAILIQSQGRNVLVDTGEHDAALLHALALCGVRHLDAVIVTHHDADHCGALAALRGTVRIGEVMSSSGIAECPCDGCSQLRESARSVCGRPLSGLNYGDTFSVGAFSARVVWPLELADEGGNADSVCLLIEHGTNGAAFRMLLVGDAESAQLEEIVERERLGNIDVYKVGHHGSKAAITPEQACVLSPDVALISVGEGNDYGHPAPSTVEALEAAGAQVLRTDQLGNVSCIFRNGRLELRAMR